jgi:hypothetical protein
LLNIAAITNGKLFFNYSDENFNAIPVFLTAAKTTSLFYFNSKEAYFNAFPLF